MGGHPCTFTMGLPVISLWTGLAPVGFGCAACMQPEQAQLPQAMIAAAPFSAPLELVKRGYSSKSAVAVAAGRHGALDAKDVFAVVLFHGAVLCGFRRKSAGSHEEVVVVKRYQLKEYLADKRM